MLSKGHPGGPLQEAGGLRLLVDAPGWLLDSVWLVLFATIDYYGC